jgi:NADH-quinone oxidoreductase subunit A
MDVVKSSRMSALTRALEPISEIGDGRVARDFGLRQGARKENIRSDLRLTSNAAAAQKTCNPLGWHGTGVLRRCSSVTAPVWGCFLVAPSQTPVPSQRAHPLFLRWVLMMKGKAEGLRICNGLPRIERIFAFHTLGEVFRRRGANPHLPSSLAPPTFLRMDASKSQLMQYIPVVLLLIVAVGFSVGTLVLSVLVGKKGRRTRIKDTAYECGMLPVGGGNTRLSVKFYLVAMLFILFDIEVVFLYPWAVNYRQMVSQHPTQILGSMICFMGILFIGYLYALKKDAFDWKH